MLEQLRLAIKYELPQYLLSRPSPTLDAPVVEEATERFV